MKRMAEFGARPASFRWLLAVLTVFVLPHRCLPALVFTSEQDFLNQLYAYYLENFEGFDVGQVDDPKLFASAGFEYKWTAGEELTEKGLYIIKTSELSKGISSFSPNILLEAYDFVGGVTAVGGYFYLTDSDGNLMDGDLTITLSDGTQVSFTTPASPPVPFRGFITSGGVTISRITITPPESGEYYATCDNFIVGVPEPSAWGLTAALGCAALTVASRLRRR